MPRKTVAISNVWIATLCLVSVISVSILARPVSLSANDKEPSEKDFSVSFGFPGGHMKMGSWAPVFIQSSSVDAKRFEISAIDGDDLPVVYRGDLVTTSNTEQFQALVRIGRKYGNVTVRLLDADNKSVAEKRFELDAPNSPLKLVPGNQNFVLVVEPEDTIQKILKSLSLKNDAGEPQIILPIRSAAELPSLWLGYDGVETIIVSSSSLDTLSSMSAVQWESIERWIQNGGRLIFSGGKQGDKTLDAGALGRFLPGTFVEIREMKDSWQLEAYATSRDQLLKEKTEFISATVLDPVTGIVDKHQDDIPLVVRQARGFGQVIFSAIDFDDGPFVEWPGRKRFFQKLLSRKTDAEKQAGNERQSSRISHFGYQDITGQLRVPLELYSQVRFVSFTIVALLIGLYILCIGPGDYFLLRKCFGRMEWTWITFSLFTLAFCCLAVFASRYTKPSQVQINQLEIIDYDSINNQTRGHLWANVFSPESNGCQIELESNGEFGFDPNGDSVVTWQGLPGNGLGGMQSENGASLRPRSYVCEFTNISNSAIQSHLIDVPMQVSSTKPLFVQWHAESNTQIKSRLKFDNRIQRIEGTVTNPFKNTELKNVRLLFDNWIYVLEQNLQGGETFDVSSEADERTLKGYLNGRVRESREKNKGRNTKWDPTSSKINRIADMLMFYDTAGGQGYTGLSHEYQPTVELSVQLDLQRAILVAELETPATELKISGLSTNAKYDKVTTIIRIVLPVKHLSSKKSK